MTEQTPTAIRLRNCPFCDGKAVFDPSGDEESDPRYWVECTVCVARGPEWSIPEKAIAGWSNAALASDPACDGGE